MEILQIKRVIQTIGLTPCLSSLLRCVLAQDNMGRIGREDAHDEKYDDRYPYQYRN
jgi:hypothetical protein